MILADFFTVEEKFGKSLKRKRTDGGDEAQQESDSDDSTSESEDEGELATEALDAEILATLQAIKSRDPRVYDTTATFYSTLDENETDRASKPKHDKPLFLQDYHRKNLLNKSHEASDDEEDNEPLTYNQEQEKLKRSILGEINAAAENESDEEQEDGEAEAFLVTKERHQVQPGPAMLDVDNADKDPETFLSNFMSSRAWASTATDLHPFESDDEEEDQRADQFEEAYNLRFEDPAKANETLRSHARDFAAKYSVRREDTNARQRKREIEKERKTAAKQERKEEKARLRKLKIEEVEDKVHKIKEAAGLRSKDIKPEDWGHFVDEDWDDAKWEEEMQKRFGEDYYAEEDLESEGEAEVNDQQKKRKTRKPKFDDDIDIKDIIPDFEADEKAEFSLTDEDMLEEASTTKSKNKRKQREEEKRDAKRERRIIEQLVDDQLKLELDTAIAHNSKSAGFRYRDTSPTSFGLSAGEILLAQDRQLNDFVGLKKLAAFRDPDKKRKDLRNLGKKSRLRKWRQDTFGSEQGLQGRDLIPKQKPDTELDVDTEDGGVDIRLPDKKKRKRRNKKRKSETSMVE